MKFTFTAVLSFFSLLAFSQNMFDDGMKSSGKNQIKVNLANPVNGQLTMLYSRAITDRFEIDLGGGFSLAKNYRLISVLGLKNNRALVNLEVAPKFKDFVNENIGGSGLHFEIEPKVKITLPQRSFLYDFFSNEKFNNYIAVRLKHSSYSNDENFSLRFNSASLLYELGFNVSSRVTASFALGTGLSNVQFSDEFVTDFITNVKEDDLLVPKEELDNLKDFNAVVNTFELKIGYKF